MDNGDVCLYRLQWHRVWAAPSHEDAACTALSWRPDGKLLAAGYSSGLLSIRHIESKESIHTEQLDSEISCISWHDRPVGFTSRDECMYSPLGEFNWDMITKLPSLEKIYSYSEGEDEQLQDCRKMEDSKTVTILLVGTKTGSIYVLISGFLMCARLSISDLTGSPSRILNTVLGTDLRTFSCVVNQMDTGCSKLLLVDCPIVSICQSELSVLAVKFNLIQGTLQYMEDTIKRIRESWENILLEMDTKLASYAKPNPPGTVAADLMELLLFGTFTTELELFLIKDMTDKGLKRMGQSIELRYSNIQRLVIRFLHPVCQSLQFQLGELLGLSRASHRFSVIGVTEEVVLEALQCAGRFWSKAVELQQIIDDSMKNFKLFFRWLYTEILRREGNEIPEELKCTTQQDVLFIAEFIRRFETDPDATDKSSHVYLEKVGQYLREEDLTQPPENMNNIWNQLVEENPQLAKVPFVLTINKNTSAVKEFNLLSSAVNKIFNGMNLDITNEISVKMDLELSTDLGAATPSDLQRSLNSAQRVEEGLLQGCASWDSHSILYWELELQEPQERHIRAQASPPSDVKATLLTIQQATVVVDFSFYTKEILSVLLETGVQQTLVQLPLSQLTGSLQPLSFNCKVMPTLSHNNIIEVGGRASCRELENIRACSFAVSGPRKVSVLLFTNRKRQRIYDMEVEEEEDEDETFNSSGLSGSTEQTSHY